ncbi:MAG: 30S ribosomal protein S9 [Armatimonadetes bacterium]|nr:30S ribosomal protein S9 [Armatimonadota bacterium]
MGPIVYGATGRRKRAVARVRLVPGDGRIFVNEKTYEDHFPRDTQLMMVRAPLEVTDTLGKFNVHARVHGGGISGQAGALRHGIARALLRFDDDLRSALRKQGYLTRDPREKERKKYGRKRARKGFQWTKR